MRGKAITIDVACPWPFGRQGRGGVSQTLSSLFGNLDEELFGQSSSIRAAGNPAM